MRRWQFRQQLHIVKLVNQCRHGQDWLGKFYFSQQELWLELVPSFFILGSCWALMPKGKVLFQLELSIERQFTGTFILLGRTWPFGQCTKLGIRSIRVQHTVRRKEPKLFGLANVGDANQFVWVRQMRRSRHLPHQKGKANWIVQTGPREKFEAFMAYW